MKLKKILQLLVSVLIAQLAGVIGSFFTVSSVGSWYLDINKPTWNPPGWIFGPVWITLYALMGIAAFMIWQSKNKHKRNALTFYSIQLVLNAIWSILFFGLRRPDLAFAEIILLLAMIIITTYYFWRINKKAAILMFPYIAWVSFASFLNFTIWQLN